MKNVSTIILIFSAISFAQISPEEATMRLQEKQAAQHLRKQEEREKIVSIKQGELEDLRTELKSLRDQIAQLKAQLGSQTPSTPTTIPSEGAGGEVAFTKSGPMRISVGPQVRYVLEVKVGTTRQQLVTFLAQHKDKYRIAKDIRDADKQELITLESFRIQRKLVGTTSNGVQSFDNYRDEKVVSSTFELVLVNDVIADISGKSGRGGGIR